MRNIYLISFIILIFFLSCEDCGCIEEDFMPVNNCNSNLLIMRSEAVTGADQTFFLDSIQKPVNTPLIFNNIQNEVQASFFGPSTRPSNYDAYNPINNTYFIEFPIQQRLFKYNIDTQTRSEFIVSGFYAAPIFHDGILYAIEVDASNWGFATDPAIYEIKTINQDNGSVTSITTGTFPLITNFNWESMSSAKDNNGNLYFVSYTNLVAFNTTSNTVSHTELVPDFDPIDNNQRFYGLEFRNNGKLIAIRYRDDMFGEGLELVELDVNNLSESPTVIYDFMSNGIELNPEYYSSSYDPCDDKYYITSQDVNNTTATNFYEIDLVNSTYKTENFSFYLMGVGIKN